MRARLLITMLLFVQLANYPLQGQNPYIKNFTVNDRLPSNNVYNVFQDSRKFVWFATDAGVVRFDGTNFKSYTTAEGLPNNEVMRIEEDSQGRLWFFHLNGSFSFIHKDILFTERNTTYLDSLSNNMYFRRMYEDSDGSLYFYSNLNREIFVLENDHNVSKYQLPSKEIFCERNNRPRQANIISKIDRSNGSYMLYLQDGIFKSESLNEIPEQHETTYSCDRAFTQKNSIFFIDAYNKHQQNHILLKYNGLNLIDSITFSNRRPGEIITYAFEDMNGNVWISSYFTGVYVYRNKMLIRHFNIEKAQNIIKDHEGNIWIASLGNGVYRMHPSILTHQHIHSKEFSGSGIKSIIKANDSSLWLSDGSFLYNLHDNKLQRSTKPLSEGGINQFAILENGLIILNEPSQALKIYKLKKNNYYTFDLHLHTKINTPIKKFAIASDLKSFAASDNFKLYLHQMDNPVSYIRRKKSETFSSVFYNAEGQLFVTGKSVFQVKNDSLIPFQPLSQLFGKTIRQHLNLDAETQVFNISGDSIWLFHADTLHSLTAHMEQKLPTQIRSMCYDGEAVLFLATKNHIYWSPDFLNAIHGKSVKINSIDIRFNNIHDLETHNHSLYVASDDGLSRLPMHSLMDRNEKIPLAYFKEIILNDSIINNNKNHSTLRGKHTIQFSLGNIQYSSEQAINAYMLEGRDSSWVIRTNGDIAYQDLRPGKYIFKFKTRLPNSDWSQEQQHFLHVKPTLIQHPLFFVFLVISIAGIIIWIYL